MLRHGRCFTLELSAVIQLALATTTGAQLVSGSVHDAVTNAPVSGAVVILSGSSGQQFARTLTSAMGTFRLVQDGATTLRVLRIGYAPVQQAIDPAGATPIVIAMTPLGRTLRPVSVVARPVCPARSDQREALALWSAATDALLAMVVASTESADSGAVVQLLYNRVFTNSGMRGGIVYWDRLVSLSSHRILTGNAEPIRADREPREFVTEGYVVNNGDITTYHGPDPEVLLDSSFAATHCLSIRQRAGEVGVAFVPTRERDSIPDIAGVLWMSRQPLALKSLTFEYQGLDRSLRDARAGGQLAFETMTNGLPVIRSWHIRSPKIFYRRNFRVVDGRTVYGLLPSVAEVHETGGLIATGRLADGTVLTSVLASLGGRVLNGRTGEGVSHATVTLDSTDQKVETDAQGQFSFDMLLAGPYTIRVRDSVTVYNARVDSAGSIVPDATPTQQLVTRTATLGVQARTGQVTPVDLRLPWRATVPGCGPAEEEVERRFLVMGLVVTEDSQPVSNATLRLSWADSTRNVTGGTDVETMTDQRGEFIICGIAARIRLSTHVLLASGGEHRGTITIVPDDDPKKPSIGRTVRITIPPLDDGARR
jgi:hypothetical protein